MRWRNNNWEGTIHTFKILATSIWLIWKISLTSRNLLYGETVISLLRLWTHNQPFLTFCTTFHHATPPHHITPPFRHAAPPYCTTTWHDSGIWDSMHLISTSREAVTCAKTRHVFRHITEGQPKELGSATMSHIAIYSIMQFNFRVACPLCAHLSKILLKLQTFPFA